MQTVREMLTLPSQLLLVACLTLPAMTATIDGADRQGDGHSVGVRISSRHSGSQRFRTLNSESRLQAGDEIRIDMTPEERSYVYVFHRAASGNWSLLFPNPEQSGDPTATNPLLPGEICSVPGENSRLVLNAILGTEELVIYTLAQPDPAVTNLAARLRRGERPQIVLAEEVQPTPRPSNNQSEPATEHDGDTIQLAARDLKIVPAPSNGVTRLPVSYALRFRFSNGAANR